jgi:hypothetical protein
MLYSVSKKYRGVLKMGLREYTLSFFPEIGSNWFILNISTFLNRFRFNVGSDYLHMFKRNSYIYRNHYLSEL